MPYDTSLDANFTKEQMLKILYQYIELKADKAGKEFMDAAVDDELVYDYMLICAANDLQISFTKKDPDEIKIFNDFDDTETEEINDEIQLLYDHISQKSVLYTIENLVKLGLLTVNFTEDGRVEYKAKGWDGEDEDQPEDEHEEE